MARDAGRLNVPTMVASAERSVATFVYDKTADSAIEASRA
jgi:hypothetical protein